MVSSQLLVDSPENWSLFHMGGFMSC